MHAKRKYEDLHTHKGMRKLLVEELRAKGITDEAVLTAINNVPRHYFLDTAFEKIAYENRAFPIAADQTISHPYTVAYQTQLLQIQKADRVLEIGTGSIYQTSILAEMGVQKIFTIERQKKLYDLHSVYVFKNKYLNIQFFLRRWVCRVTHVWALYKNIDHLRGTTYSSKINRATRPRRYYGNTD